MAVRAKAVTSMKQLKQDLKKGGGGDEWLLRVAADDEKTVRLLTEPDGWVDYREHFVQEHGFFPCDTNDCVGCDDGNKSTVKYAIAVLDVDEDRVRIMSVGKTTADALYKNYDKRHTLLDRDYTIQRTGSGKDDTSYTVLPEDKQRRNLSRYDIPSQEDIIVILERMVPGNNTETDEDDEEDLNERLPSRRGAPRKAAKKATTKKKPIGRKPAGKTAARPLRR